MKGQRTAISQMGGGSDRGAHTDIIWFNRARVSFPGVPILGCSDSCPDSIPSPLAAFDVSTVGELGAVSSLSSSRVGLGMCGTADGAGDRGC